MKEPARPINASAGPSKTYICTYGGCTASFSKGTKLERHLRTHTGERPYICDVPGCGMTYTRNDHLTRHRASHQGERRYACEVSGCEKRFGSKSHLRRHQRSHEIGKIKHKCMWPGCMEQFVKAIQLRRHALVHDPGKVGVYSCTNRGCGKAFKYPSLLASHRISHSKERYFCKPGCGMGFLRSADLERHMAHAGCLYSNQS